MDIFIRIDNGVSGQIAVIKNDDWRLIDKPIKKELNYAGNRNLTRIDFTLYRNLIQSLYSARDIKYILMEYPYKSPHNMNTTESSLRCFESELIAIEQLGLKLEFIHSRTWQGKMIPGNKGRDNLKLAAVEHAEGVFKGFEGKDADALMIALYMKQRIMV